MKDFYNLFLEELCEIYSSENQAIKVVPRLIQMTKSPRLKQELEAHLEETRKQLHRLDQIAKELGENISNGQCKAMQGLWKDWEHVAQGHYLEDAQDAAVISFMQKVKHYQIALYGTLKTFARHLNFPRIEKLLQESSREEGRADKSFTEIAEGSMAKGGINQKACKKRCA